ncbi:ABC transporter permease [Shewanella sp. WXL01]|uniref:ABC transporter permease n=1 Tax=Shewanella sp. WXL01 TaxID=2709721 RepID=UPI0014383362|nr:ABC transporter permease [Shewanella sp. WXL01]NKF49159.1 ABC transporter permease [Shewanella sp. WXL01]
MDISWLALGLFMLVLIAPAAINRHYQLGLGREMLVAISRMTVQMLLVGIYLEFVFALDSLALNLTWLAIMLVVGSSAIIGKAKLPKQTMFMPMTLGLLIGVTPILAILMLGVFGPTPFYKAQFLIPTAGMLLGNSLSNNIIALTRLFDAFNEKQAEYQGALALGATPTQAATPFIQSAMQQAFAPILASMATTGIVSLPGMMTGQILGGSDPIVAVKYQIVILVAVLACISLSVSSALWLTLKKLLNETGKMRFNRV